MTSARKTRIVRALVGLAAAAVLSVGAGASVGFAQYGEEPPTTTAIKLGPAAPPGSPERRAQLKACIAKAKAKFASNAVKRKKKIKACKKKYG